MNLRQPSDTALARAIASTWPRMQLTVQNQSERAPGHSLTAGPWSADECAYLDRVWPTNVPKGEIAQILNRSQNDVERRVWMRRLFRTKKA